jgi:O-antigen/teichoic acid export membrane protein
LAPTATHFTPEKALPVWFAGALANIGLNLVLIPPFGVNGAVAATVASYALTIPIAIWVSRSIWVVPFEWTRLATIAVAGIVAGVTASRVDFGVAPIVALVAVPAAGVALYVALLLLLRFPSPEEWRTLRGMTARAPR